MHAQVKKCFLQACVNHGTLSRQKLNDILLPICAAYDVEAPINDDELNDLIKELNDQIKELQQCLTWIQHPLVKQEFLVFGLTTENIICKNQPHYNNADKYYFAKLLEKMAQREDYGLSWEELYYLDGSSEFKKQLPKSRMQELLNIWTEQGYFLEHEDVLYFGPRMLVEYSQYLKTHHADLVKNCPLCNELVFWDTQCSNCRTKIHLTCIRKYLRRMSTCPACSKKWATRLSGSQ